VRLPAVGLLSKYHEARGRTLSMPARLAITCVVLALSVFVATRFGLVALIASGYRWLAYAILTIYVLPLPLVTLGLWRIVRRDRSSDTKSQAVALSG
jgi:uncharacterized membrane protein YkvI